MLTECLKKLLEVLSVWIHNWALWHKEFLVHWRILACVVLVQLLQSNAEAYLIWWLFSSKPFPSVSPQWWNLTGVKEGNYRTTKLVCLFLYISLGSKSLKTTFHSGWNELSFTQQPQFVIMFEGHGSTHNHTLSEELIGLHFSPSKFL